MVWNIIFFKNRSGDEIVKNDIRRFEEPTISKIGRLLDLLRYKGPFLLMPYSKKIKGNLFELRVRGFQEVRIFYTFRRGSVHVLHVFQKKSQKTPVKELKTALERLRRLTTI